MKTCKAWPAYVTMVALFVLHHSEISVAQPAGTTRAAQKIVRLALLDSSRNLNGSVDRNVRKVVLDLLTARLSEAQGFELVERSALDAIFRELSLSAANLSRPADAIQVGRMLKADWFLILSYPEAATNTVLGKILDASTGVIRDLKVMPLKPGDPSGAVEAFAAFALASRNSGLGLEGRLWIGFGGFQDLGMYSRYPDFGDRMRTAMALKYTRARVSVVERSQVMPMVEELRLSMNGFTAMKTNRTSPQPAFILVDGVYQAFQDEQSKINLVLRMEWVGGRKGTVAIKELPGAPVEAKVAEVIDQFLAESPFAATNSPTREVEARAQLIRGRELARMPEDYFVPPDGTSRWSIYPKDRAPRVRDAISAFESALFLDPENLKAKFCLAGCLADPVIDQVENARDLWREIAATTTKALAANAAKSALAASYVEQDDFQALGLMMALRSATTNLQERARLNSRLRAVRGRLGEASKLAPADMLEFAVDAWRTDCQLAEIRISEGKNIDAYMTFSNSSGDFYHAFSGANSTQARREYIGGVVSNLALEFPQLEPYLVASYATREGVSTYWVDRYKRMLVACEEKPERIPDPASFFRVYMMEDLRNSIERKDYEWADRVVRMFEKSGRSFLGIQMEKDDLDFLAGHVRFKLKRFDEAIAAFERIGSRQVDLFRIEDVWGAGKVRSISGIRAAEICREQAVFAANPAGRALRADIKPVQILPGDEISFAIDGGQIWLADRISFYRYVIQSGELKPVPARVNPRVRRIIVHRGKIWFATADGLFAFDPADGSVVTNSVNDGLLIPSVTALVADMDRIWVGFGEVRQGSNIGGLGYLNLVQNRYVGLMSELPASLAAKQSSKETSNPWSQPESAHRRYVTGLAKRSSGPLWVSTTSRLLRYDDRGGDAWQTAVPAFSGAISASVVANEDFVVIPCYEPNGRSSELTMYGGVFVYDIHKKTHRRITNTEGLPNNNLYAAVIDGPKAWLGGKGFVALIDLVSMRVEKTFPFPSSLRVRSMAMEGNDLWFSSGPGLYRLPKDGDVESVPAGPASATAGAVVAEIADLQSARELFKKREEVFRTYGTRETAEHREMTARYNAFLRKAAHNFPLLESLDRKGTNHFVERIINKEGRGYDGFRFKGTLQERADFGWIFTHEWPSSFYQWTILPMEAGPWVGFTDFFEPKIAYTNAPWSSLKGQFRPILQFLHDGQVEHGKEYFVWMDFRDERPSRFFMAFDLFPASAGHRSRSVLEGTFGLGGPPISAR